MNKIILISILLFLFYGCDKTNSSNTNKNSEINSGESVVAESQKPTWYLHENPFYVELKTNNFVKNVMIDGFSVKFYDNLGCSADYKIKDLEKDETREIIIEYTKYSKNGFGHHLNEENKKIKVEVARSLETRQEKSHELEHLVYHYQDIILD